jgi:hypothetical protein
MANRKSPREMRTWCIDAGPILASLVRSVDDVLSRLDGPAVALTASLDQLEAAWAEAEDWLYDHPCPDSEAGAQFDSLVRSCGGIWAIGSGYREYTDEPERKDTAEIYLRNRVAAASMARAYLGQRGIR